MSINRFSVALTNGFVKQNGFLPAVQFHLSNQSPGRSRTSSKSQERALPKGFRPPTPYSLLTKEVYHAGMSIPEVGKVAAEKWKNLSQEKLQAYKNEAEKIGKQRKEQFDLLPKTEKALLYAKQDKLRTIRKLRSQLEESIAASD